MRNYEKLKEIGEGAFGKAFLVRKNNADSHEELCVLKQIDLSDLDESTMADALTEVQCLAGLDHPMIIRCRDSFIHKQKLVIVMDFADKGDLGQYLSDLKEKSESLDEETVILWFSQAVEALRHVHFNKVLHRDIKPQNVFLNQDGTVKLGDFGIAKVMEGENVLAKTNIGTPYYMSPEVFNQKAYNEKSDIWGLGCVLYEMLSLKRPFAAKTELALAMKISRAQFDPLPEGRYSKELTDLLTKMLSVNPEDRPSTVEILGDPWLRGKIAALVGKRADIPHLHLLLRSHVEVQQEQRRSRSEILNRRSTKTIKSVSSRRSSAAGETEEDAEDSDNSGGASPTSCARSVMGAQSAAVSPVTVTPANQGVNTGLVNGASPPMTHRSSVVKGGTSRKTTESGVRRVSIGVTIEAGAETSSKPPLSKSAEERERGSNDNLPGGGEEDRSSEGGESGTDADGMMTLLEKGLVSMSLAAGRRGSRKSTRESFRDKDTQREGGGGEKGFGGKSWGGDKVNLHQSLCLTEEDDELGPPALTPSPPSAVSFMIDVAREAEANAATGSSSSASVWPLDIEAAKSMNTQTHSSEARGAERENSGYDIDLFDDWVDDSSSESGFSVGTIIDGESSTGSNKPRPFHFQVEGDGLEGDAGDLGYPSLPSHLSPIPPTEELLPSQHAPSAPDLWGNARSGSEDTPDPYWRHPSLPPQPPPPNGRSPRPHRRIVTTGGGSEEASSPSHQKSVSVAASGSASPEVEKGEVKPAALLSNPFLVDGSLALNRRSTSHHVQILDDPREATETAQTERWRGPRSAFASPTEGSQTERWRGFWPSAARRLQPYPSLSRSQVSSGGKQSQYAPPLNSHSRGPSDFSLSHKFGEGRTAGSRDDLGGPRGWHNPFSSEGARPFSASTSLHEPQWLGLNSSHGGSSTWGGPRFHGPMLSSASAGNLHESRSFGSPTSQVVSTPAEKAEKAGTDAKRRFTINRFLGNKPAAAAGGMTDSQQSSTGRRLSSSAAEARRKSLIKEAGKNTGSDGEEKAKGGSGKAEEEEEKAPVYMAMIKPGRQGSLEMESAVVMGGGDSGFAQQLFAGTWKDFDPNAHLPSGRRRSSAFSARTDVGPERQISGRSERAGHMRSTSSGGREGLEIPLTLLQDHTTEASPTSRKSSGSPTHLEGGGDPSSSTVTSPTNGGTLTPQPPKQGVQGGVSGTDGQGSHFRRPSARTRQATLAQSSNETPGSASRPLADGPGVPRRVSMAAGPNRGHRASASGPSQPTAPPARNIFGKGNKETTAAPSLHDLDLSGLRDDDDAAESPKGESSSSSSSGAESAAESSDGGNVPNFAMTRRPKAKAKPSQKQKDDEPDPLLMTRKPDPLLMTRKPPPKNPTAAACGQKGVAAAAAPTHPKTTSGRGGGDALGRTKRPGAARSGRGGSGSGRRGGN
uniref:non-specific serine/threonine protein kinase n=1 Tax=Chromera velia CCMP2878 TaxID=1169474 RepID=A0A0G4G8N4_9ALVE|eukprot:Cvel_20762.t1-p1 / transcript=Cvel_20762.t1 / gene=Cvel_20762 / organism=Chromera_velia_CCMP2878 / gene_product=Serine/threonine-protein kinase Nek1, putative / transcript_product=Serine/threonine-protein kinase Nek1, putative / location=Cvel_scaffold1893:1395-6186(+) / protein_length=1427 / sequence_SO=supercontig / SO=protein_coding / is_pseudo=false